MGLKNFHIKLKAFRLKRFIIRGAGKRKKEQNYGNVVSWMAPVSHGYHVVENRSFGDESNDELNPDSVIVQREQIEELEVWFFGVSDDRIGDYVTKYMQVHLFNKKPKKSHMRRKGKEAMRKAYLGVRSKVKQMEKSDNVRAIGSASAIVINGEKLMMANLGDYQAIVCRDGKAYQINGKRQVNNGRHWSRKFLSGVFQKPKSQEAPTKVSKGLDFEIGEKKIDCYTEFAILASTGIWEVMKHQEAVNLIRHIDDPQEAAECLAKEAINRMSRSSISCFVIRFE